MRERIEQGARAREGRHHRMGTRSDDYYQDTGSVVGHFRATGAQWVIGNLANLFDDGSEPLFVGVRKSLLMRWRTTSSGSNARSFEDRH